MEAAMNPLRIGLLGYGKMGQMIEQLTKEAGYTIVWRVGTQNRAAAEDPAFLRLADVVIEFSRPEAAFHNVMTASMPVFRWCVALRVGRGVFRKQRLSVSSREVRCCGPPISALVSIYFLH